MQNSIVLTEATAPLRLTTIGTPASIIGCTAGQKPLLHALMTARRVAVFPRVLARSPEVGISRTQ